MKRFLLFAVLCCGAFDALADTYNCTVQDMSSWSSRISNEFLFPTIAHYNGREALVCGHRGTEGCGNGKIVVVTGAHVWKKKTITDVKIYECATGGANAWYDIGASKLQKCGSTNGRRLITAIGDKDVWAPDSVTAVHALSEYYVSNDFCYTVHGAGEGGDDNVSVLDKCDASVCKTELCQACCRKGVANAVWEPQINKCLCVNGGDFTKENNAWICKQKTFACDKALLERANAWKKQNCKYWPDMVKRIEDLEKFCDGDAPDKSTFLRLYDELKADVEKNCVQVDYSEEHATILSASKVLSDMSVGFDVTVWKDEDGNFNTARLASDSVAGVVLGTVGGLVTSNVVKKNQVENGFEDIKCVIGGQTVSDWGDKFKVGVK